MNQLKQTLHCAGSAEVGIVAEACCVSQRDWQPFVFHYAWAVKQDGFQLSLVESDVVHPVMIIYDVQKLNCRVLDVRVFKQPVIFSKHQILAPILFYTESQGSVVGLGNSSTEVDSELDPGKV